MRRLRPGHITQRPGAESARQSLPSQLFHVSRVPETTVNRRGTLRARRQQIHLQRGLSGGE